MRDALRFALIPLALVAIVNLPHSALAADAGAVLAACDRTAGCGYSQNKETGDITGCSKQSNTCFVCQADGKHQCFAVRSTNGKNNVKRTATNIGGVVIEPGKVPPKAGVGTVKTGGAKQATTSSDQKDKTNATASRNKQMQNSSGGGSDKRK